MRARHRHFNPRFIGAKLVLDARYINQSDNTAVSTWADRSGNGWGATQTDSNFRPTLQTAEFGGQNIVRFDGTNDRLVANGAVGMLNNVGGAVLFCVGKYANSVGSKSVLAFGTPAGLTRATLSLFSASGYGIGGRRLDANSFQFVASNAGLSATRTVLHTGVIDYSNARAELFVDGNSAAVSTSFQTSGNTSATDSNNVVIGSGVGFADLMEGDLATIAGFNIALNASQRKRLEHAAAYSFKISCN